ncbi:hypothetical protein LZ198_37105 [Myxococcus sp. K15C18031901]|uniref:hypothetical protein n=1 Tax=Myxococcus dinghuensis TaxID=2906761 RepID=UPI0020A77A12|nr:hypothetical protein [Myxococcus dinghuensis]MCP3104496.1 hypothetical protein [Myxococcus dinghuensis]
MESPPARELFGRYYADALRIRDAVRDCAPLASWFPLEIKRFPPIICFGFPTESSERIPLVTLGINPSTDEIRDGHISCDESPDVQFRDQARYFERRPLKWFERAQLVMQTLSEDLPKDRRATYGGRFFGGKRNTVHLDLTPVITAAIDGPKKAAQRAKRPFAEPAEIHLLLTLGARGILEPLLSAFIERHGVRVVVALGGLDRLNAVGLSTHTCPQKWPSIQWASLGSGPSAQCADNELVARTRLQTKAAQLVQEALMVESR